MFLKDRSCSQCGSTLVCWSKGFEEPHCFVCGYNHPKIEFPMRGAAHQLISRIELDGHKCGMKIFIITPSVVFIDGYAYSAKSLLGPPETWQENTEETRKIRTAA